MDSHSHEKGAPARASAHALDRVGVFVSRLADTGLPIKVQRPVKGAHRRRFLVEGTTSTRASDKVRARHASASLACPTWIQLV